MQRLSCINRKPLVDLLFGLDNDRLLVNVAGSFSAAERSPDFFSRRYFNYQSND